ncbi:hypothetical protein, partial [Anabaena sp. FACHB-1391]|uniref:hypothetical protein n=1 Tax=Anabaena sp. FACHB-1391 TaxID=2692771 RepID=UPI001A7EF662
ALRNAPNHHLLHHFIVTAVPDIHKIQILIIKLLWCGHLARTKCTSLKATCCNLSPHQIPRKK